MKSLATFTDWERIFPFTDIEGSLVVTLRGEPMIGWEIILPEACSILETEYDAMLQGFTGAIRALPDWVVVHRQDIYLKEPYMSSPDGSFLGDAYERRYGGKTFLTHHQYLYLIASSKARVTDSISGSVIFGKDFLKNIPTAEDLGEFRSMADEFITACTKGTPMKARLLTEGDYFGKDGNSGILGVVRNLGERTGVLCDVRLSPDTVQTQDRSLVGFTISQSESLPPSFDTVSPISSMSTSTSSVLLGVASPLGIGLKEEHICNLYIIKPNQKDVLGELDSRRRKMTSMNKDRGNAVGSQEIEDYLTQTQSSALVSVWAHCNILAWADGNEELQRVRSDISAALTSIRVDAARDTYDLPVLWYASFPGAGSNIGKENLFLMELTSSLALGQYESYDRGFPGEGTLRLSDRLSGRPLRIDLMAGAEKAGLIDNWHAFVLGASGSGKSVFMNNNAYSRYALGGHVFIIDVGDSYESSCAIVSEESGGRDGVYNRWDTAHPFSFNPLSQWREWLSPQGALYRDNQSLDFLISVIKTIWTNRGQGWNDTMDAVLVELVGEFVRTLDKQTSYPVFSDLYDWLCERLVYGEDSGEKRGTMRPLEYRGLAIDSSRFDAVDFLASLSSYATGGQFGFLLNERHPKDIFTSRYTVFEVGKLKDTNNESFYSICILCIVNEFNRKMRSVSVPKTMIIDEAWQAISNKTMAPYLRELWKTARKYLCSAIVVTQEIEDITASEVIKETILQNSPIKVILNQSANQNNFEKIAVPLGLSPRDRNLCLSMQGKAKGGAREVFITWGGKKSGVYLHELCPEQALAFESNKMRKAPLMELAARKGSILSAIRELSNTKNR